jgi:hypothetical protein
LSAGVVAVNVVDARGLPDTRAIASALPLKRIRAAMAADRSPALLAFPFNAR